MAMNTSRFFVTLVLMACAVTAERKAFASPTIPPLEPQDVALVNKPVADSASLNAEAGMVVDDGIGVAPAEWLARSDRAAASSVDVPFNVVNDDPSFTNGLVRCGTWFADGHDDDWAVARMPDFSWAQAAVDPEPADPVTPAAVPLPPALGVGLVTFGLSVWACRRKI